ncbi:calcium-independent phospholipase A2-gamma-like [Oncorhynchus tshawytscha]|uniref:calcium-independent phospholipase A2-gamma-like n=1 Tax=Oncorhynchus tshawytscha TaxID=74940 RepID=UPI001C3C2C0D|nr:calcium-independent phospholipase A2-gamma-like [Oncorhynchus tshawytscha]
MSLRCVPDSCVLKVSRAANFWHTQGQRAASLPLSSQQHPPCRFDVRAGLSHKVGFLSWKYTHSTKSRIRNKIWLSRASQIRHRLGLHTSIYYLNTSTSRWSTGLSHTMSRFRSTLDSVSKAVSGSHAELLSKIARLKAKPKQNAIEAGKVLEANPEMGLTPQGHGTVGYPALTPAPVPAYTSANTTVNAPPPIPASVSAPSPPPTTATASTPTPTLSPTLTPTPYLTPGPTPGITASAPPIATPRPNIARANAAVSGPSIQEVRQRRVQRAATASIVPTAVATNGTSNGTTKRLEQVRSPLPTDSSVPERATTTVSQQTTTQLFHPSSFSVNLDETYNYLSHHVNSYFSNITKSDEDKEHNTDRGSTDLLPMSDKTSPGSAAPVSSPSSKKGIGRYLSYSGDTVQAFVGSYIAPLVPRFSRAAAEPKSAAVEQKRLKAEEAGAKPWQGEVAVNTEQKAAEERAKRLLLQREKIIARVSVDNRTRSLVKALNRASDVRVYINRVEELSFHLLEFPETRGVAVKEKAIPCLLRLRQAEDSSLKAAVREALTLVGYTNPVKGQGIRVLSIDGGGTRGLIALQTLQKLEALTGKPIYQLFDYICGVSTGSILGFMLGVFQIPLNECEVLYRKLGSDVFKQNVIVGTVKMGWSHAFYDSETWENILKEKMGSDLMVETSRNPKCPKMAAVSTIVNRGTPLKAYVFRNYNLQPGVRSHYLGAVNTSCGRLSERPPLPQGTSRSLPWDTTFTRMEVSSSTTPQRWPSMSVNACGPIRRSSVWCHWVQAAWRQLAKTTPRTPASRPSSQRHQLCHRHRGSPHHARCPPSTRLVLPLQPLYK